MPELELLSHLGVALGIGLLVGLERGWYLRDEGKGQRPAGLRTFALSGLLGGVSGALALEMGPVLLGFLFVGFAIPFTAFHLLDAQQDKNVSATSVIAGLLTFALGAYALVGESRIAGAAAVAMVLLLALRESLHRWVASLKWEEIRAGLILLAMTFLLLPILPDRTMDPWGAINPAEIWLLAIMIAAISFGGYVAIRLFGDRLGIILAALAGGLASSTATTLTLARMGKEKPGSERLLAGGILVSGTVMVARVVAVVGVLNRPILAALVVPLAAAGLVLAVAAALLLLLGRREKDHSTLELKNPLELGTALKLVALIVMVMLAAELVQDWIGPAGVLLVAAVSGIADVDAMTISMSRLGGASIPAATAVGAIAIVVGVNSLAKALMAGWVGGWKIGALVGGASLLAVAAGAALLLA